MMTASRRAAGGFLIVDVGEDAEVHGNVANFLFKDQIRHLQNRGLWPAAFGAGRETQAQADDLLTSNPNHMARDAAGDESESESDEDDSDLMPNPNRRPAADSQDEGGDEQDGGGAEEEEPTSQAREDVSAAEAAAEAAACTS